jgi:CRP-like cAMP-binding protein
MGDRWLQIAAERVDDKATSVKDSEDWKDKETLMERLLVLRKIPLFAQMTMDQLEAINQLLKEVQYVQGEVIFDQGALGDELYILVEGRVRIVQSRGTSEEIELNRMAGVSYFGEMAILDDEPRSASVVCDEDSRLLVLKGDQLKELIHQMPEISFEIFKVLTARIRINNSRVGSQALRSGEVRTN